MDYLKSLALASRPKTLVASIFPVLTALLLSLPAREGFEWLPVYATLLCAVSLQILTNISNDYFDFIKGADNEHRIGPKRAVQSGLIPPNLMKQYVIINIFISLLLGVYLVLQGGFPILAIGVSAILLAVGYTAGPFPLAYKGLGEVTSFIYFGIIASIGSYYLFNDTFGLPSFCAGTLYGFLSVALIGINNLRDLESDRKANKKTIVVRFGEGFGKTVVISSLLSTQVLLFIFVFFNFLPATTILASGSAILLFKAVPLIRENQGKELIAVFALVAKYFMIYGLLLNLGLLWRLV